MLFVCSTHVCVWHNTLTTALEAILVLLYHGILGPVNYQMWLAQGHKSLLNGPSIKQCDCCNYCDVLYSTAVGFRMSWWCVSRIEAQVRLIKSQISDLLGGQWPLNSVITGHPKVSKFQFDTAVYLLLLVILEGASGSAKLADKDCTGPTRSGLDVPIYCRAALVKIIVSNRSLANLIFLCFCNMIINRKSVEYDITMQTFTI